MNFIRTYLGRGDVDAFGYVARLYYFLLKRTILGFGAEVRCFDFKVVGVVEWPRYWTKILAAYFAFFRFPNCPLAGETI
ncbi:hypothetical protein WDW86_00800 [Bdellovibrionota bacterium FG-2]